MTRYDMIKEYLWHLDTDELVSLHNARCDAEDNPDDLIYNMDAFDDILYKRDPYDIARMCYYTNQFCPAHNYFWLDAYGNIGSADIPETCHDSPLCINDLARYIDKTGDDLGDDGLRALLDSYNDNEEVSNNVA